MSRKTQRTNSFSKLCFSKSILLLSSKGANQKVKLSLPQYKIFLLWCSLLFCITVLYDSSMLQRSTLRTYFHTLRWTPLPIGVGFALVAFQQYRHTRRRESTKLSQHDPCSLADEWEVQAYKLLPLRSFSRVLGWFTGIELPLWSRGFLLGSYVKTFGCNMAEAEVEDIYDYKCLSDLFRRRLKASVRPIDSRSDIVSPADGTVLHLGKVDCGKMEQIKGISYSVKGFLGPNCWSEGGPTVMDENKDECFHLSCMKNPIKNDLYYVAIYLAPGDYHCFHSPADWVVSFRRHFPGELLSVCPAIAAWVKDLFVLNERVCYVGQWDKGFISMTAVGATNVGSVVVPFDRELKTNTKLSSRSLYQSFYDHYFENNNITKKKGENFGEFNLGSTIVLIFEAPKGVKLTLKPGEKVLVGQAILRE